MKQIPKTQAMNRKLSLGFATILMVGVATLTQANAQIKIGFQAPLTGPSPILSCR